VDAVLAARSDLESFHGEGGKVRGWGGRCGAGHEKRRGVRDRNARVCEAASFHAGELLMYCLYFCDIYLDFKRSRDLYHRNPASTQHAAQHTAHSERATVMF